MRVTKGTLNPNPNMNGLDFNMWKKIKSTATINLNNQLFNHV
jgi:hypothetical protein